MNLNKKFQLYQIKFILKKYRKKIINNIILIIKANRICRLFKKRNFITWYNLLYNDLIKLLEIESLGWYERNYENIKNSFIKALINLL